MKKTLPGPRTTNTYSSQPELPDQPLPGLIAPSVQLGTEVLWWGRVHDLHSGYLPVDARGCDGQGHGQGPREPGVGAGVIHCRLEWSEKATWEDLGDRGKLPGEEQDRQ